MEYFYCGIDVSKDSLDYAICNQLDKSILLVSKTENSVAGIRKMIKLVQKNSQNKSIWYCFEHTGHYGLLLAHMLQEKEIKYSMVPSIDIMRSSGLTRGKSDPIDARRIAIYLATFSFKIEPSLLACKSILKIKSLLTIRDQYVRVRTQFKNALKSLEITVQNIDLKAEIKMYKKEIERYNKLVNGIEAKIKEIIKQDKKLNKNYQKVTKVIGIGPITAAAMLVFTNNFIAFKDPRKFNCYCGLAPFEYSSGTSVKRPSKTSKYRNKEMKKLLFNAANTAINHDQQLRTYFNRKTTEGKHKMSVINAIACKLVLRAFAVVNRNTPYVKFSV